MLGIFSINISQLEGISIYLIVGGVLCKLAFITSVIKSGQYRVGVEIVFLMAGLALFFIGKSELGNILLSWVFIFSGISLKILFVILFIRKLKAGRKK